MRDAILMLAVAGTLAGLPVLATAAPSGYAAAAAATAHPLPPTQRLERRFLQLSAANLRVQAEASRLAADRTNNPAVKELANSLLARQKTTQP